ncbi:hypothetical protein FE257_004893 [Aspergillus nanangensis]|uniref:EthD domain-containing protein n=1 Tax=Aspergillus nanangensis TaxID=2582783 RepID=A0AAD4GMY9_ASPNN|nr:hypothetical protein FE257_004893 [Aspergillus nanangensis]
MAVRYLLLALSRPHSVSSTTWKKFYTQEHIRDMVSHDVVRKGALYEQFPNPLGRAPPDNKSFLAMYETDFARCLHTDEFASGVKTTSELFPRNGGPEDVADLEVRNYELVEIFNPKGVGSDLPPAPYLYEAEAEPADIEEFHRFYREDHAAMMSKHAGYRRTLHYRLATVEGSPQETPNPVLVIHEFNSFEDVGGPITWATMETPFAKKVLPRVKSMKTRTLKLV